MATNGTSNGASKGRFSESSTVPLWLDGKEVTTGTTFDVISPVSNRKLYSCAGASEKVRPIPFLSSPARLPSRNT